MVLTERQQQELNAAIADYFRERGFTRALQALEAEVCVCVCVCVCDAAAHGRWPHVGGGRTWEVTERARSVSGGAAGAEPRGCPRQGPAREEMDHGDGAAEGMGEQRVLHHRFLSCSHRGGLPAACAGARSQAGGCTCRIACPTQPHGQHGPNHLGPAASRQVCPMLPPPPPSPSRRTDSPDLARLPPPQDGC